MSFPITFGAYVGTAPMNSLDQMFAQVGQYTVIGCTCSGTNTLALTPIAGQVPITAYVTLQFFSFIAQNNNTASVSVNINGLGAIILYGPDGNTLSANAITAGAVIEIATDGAGKAWLIGSSGGGSFSGNATSIQNVTVSSAAPTSSQILQYNASSGIWQPSSVAGLTFSGARVRKTTNQLITGPSTGTVLTWQAADFDTNSYWDGNTKLVVPSGVNYVVLRAGLTMHNTAINTHSAYFLLAGSGFQGMGSFSTNATGVNEAPNFNFTIDSGPQPVVAGNAFTVAWDTQTGAQIDAGTTTWFSIQAVG